MLVGKKKRSWQDRDYVLRYFGQTEREAKTEYVSYVSCYLAVRRLGIACRTVAKELNISPSGVSRSVERGLEILRDGNIEGKILITQ